MIVTMDLRDNDRDNESWMNLRNLSNDTSYKVSTLFPFKKVRNGNHETDQLKKKTVHNEE